MCQQTQAATAAPYYIRWLERFPDIETLAKAQPDDVRKAWAGLGYYSRATRLLSGAQKVVNECEGFVPESVDTLQNDIDGIGP